MKQISEEEEDCSRRLLISIEKRAVEREKGEYNGPPHLTTTPPPFPVDISFKKQ
jgi:hypothetical protein